MEQINKGGNMTPLDCPFAWANFLGWLLAFWNAHETLIVVTLSLWVFSGFVLVLVWIVFRLIGQRDFDSLGDALKHERDGEEEHG